MISIDYAANFPVVASGVTATCKRISLSTSGGLVIDSGGINETSASSSGFAAIALTGIAATLLNNGTLNITSNSIGIRDCFGIIEIS